MASRYHLAMTKTTVCKDFTFDAAHQLPNHSGKCRRLHGHTYRVRFEFTGEVKPVNGSADEGMVVDFYDIKQAWREHLEPLLDHQFLNDTIGGEVGVTTAENLAAWLLDKMTELVNGATAVSVWETPTSCARVERG